MLNQTENQNIEQLIKITSSVDNLYKRLAELEISGQKESEEYEKNMEYLRITLEVEEQCYQDLKANNNLFDIIKYILNNKIPNPDIPDLENIVLGHTDNRVNVRILKKLQNMVQFTRENLLSMFHINLQSDVGKRFKETVSLDKVIAGIQTGNSIDIDCFNMFLSLVEESKIQENSETFKRKLSEVKYEVAFIVPDVEQNMINQNFVVKSSAALGSDVTAKIFGISNSEYQSKKLVFGAILFEKQITKLFELNDSDYENEDVFFSASLRQLLMRTSFLFMDDKIVKDMKEDFQKTILSKKYLEAHEHNRISEAVISQAFIKSTSDKDKHVQVSLNI